MQKKGKNMSHTTTDWILLITHRQQLTGNNTARTAVAELLKQPFGSPLPELQVTTTYR